MLVVCATVLLCVHAGVGRLSGDIDLDSAAAGHLSGDADLDNAGTGRLEGNPVPDEGAGRLTSDPVPDDGAGHLVGDAVSDEGTGRLAGDPVADDGAGRLVSDPVPDSGADLLADNPVPDDGGGVTRTSHTDIVNGELLVINNDYQYKTSVKSADQSVRSPAHDTDHPAHDADHPAPDTDQPTHNADQPTHDAEQPAPNTDKPAHDDDQTAHDPDQPAPNASPNKLSIVTSAPAKAGAGATYNPKYDKKPVMVNKDKENKLRNFLDKYKVIVSEFMTNHSEPPAAPRDRHMAAPESPQKGSAAAEGPVMRAREPLASVPAPGSKPQRWGGSSAEGPLQRARDFPAGLDHRPASGAQLDMSPARGGLVSTLRNKNRLCFRHVMIPEGPKYNSKGRVYLAAHAHARAYEHTRSPKVLLPKCCNCCRKSVLGCQ